MTCEDALDAMLVADPAELEEKDAGALAEHMRGCTECRRRALVLARGTSALRLTAARRGVRRSRRAAGVVFFAAAAAVVLVVSMHGGREIQPTVASTVASLPVARHVTLEVAPGQRATLIKTNDPKVTVIWLSTGEGK
jgi:hypothetical protein